MKLYAIQDKVNEAIRRYTGGFAAVDIYRAGRLEHSIPFVQAMQIKQGLVITTGEDDYLPSSTMHLIEGIPEFDEENKLIRIKQGSSTNAIIREATLREENSLLEYIGFSTDEDKARIAKHVESFRAACADTEAHLE